MDFVIGLWVISDGFIFIDSKKHLSACKKNINYMEKINKRLRLRFLLDYSVHFSIGFEHLFMEDYRKADAPQQQRQASKTLRKWSSNKTVFHDPKGQNRKFIVRSHVG